MITQGDIASLVVMGSRLRGDDYRRSYRAPDISLAMPTALKHSLSLPC